LADAPHVELPNKDMSGTELSPRNLPVGVAIAIGPSPRKPGSSSASRDCGAPQSAYEHAAVVQTLWQQLFLAKNQLRTKSELSSPPRAPKQVGA
jgi:hypothetical protein